MDSINEDELLDTFRILRSIAHRIDEAIIASSSDDELLHVVLKYYKSHHRNDIANKSIAENAAIFATLAFRRLIFDRAKASAYLKRFSKSQLMKIEPEDEKIESTGRSKQTWKILARFLQMGDITVGDISETFLFTSPAPYSTVSNPRINFHLTTRE